jgi:hypothetical protein
MAIICLVMLVMPVPEGKRRTYYSPNRKMSFQWEIINLIENHLLEANRLFQLLKKNQVHAGDGSYNEASRLHSERRGGKDG